MNFSKMTTPALVVAGDKDALTAGPDLPLGRVESK
jgi:hypothetical protein